MAHACPICGGETGEVRNVFCEAYVGLRFPDVDLHHYECQACGHGELVHDLALDRLYLLSIAMPMDHGRDERLDFIKAHLDLGKVTGEIVEIGGGPGELAEQTRVAMGRERACVVDFVSRVGFPNLDFVKVDLNDEAGRIGESFDAEGAHLFLLSHIVEHLADPGALVGQLQRFDNSFVYVEVPDFGSPHVPASLRWQMNGLEHVQYFNDASLIDLLHTLGFQVLAFETQGAPEMPAIRALCTPRKAAFSALQQNNDLFHLVSGRLRDRILSEPEGREIWVWGLSPYMADALTQLGEARSRITGIIDNRYSEPQFLGLPVLKEPTPTDGAPLIVCGSTFSVVQSAFGAKAARVAPNAEFFTVPLEG